MLEKTQAYFKNKLEKLMQAKGWKVPDLAKASGLSPSGLYGHVDGERFPGPDNLDRIADALGVPVRHLFPGEKEPPEMDALLEKLGEQQKKIRKLEAEIQSLKKAPLAGSLSPLKLRILDAFNIMNEPQLRAFARAIFSGVGWDPSSGEDTEKTKKSSQ